MKIYYYNQTQYIFRKEVDGYSVTKGSASEHFTKTLPHWVRHLPNIQSWFKTNFE